jgi:CHRD domain
MRTWRFVPAAIAALCLGFLAGPATASGMEKGGMMDHGKLTIKLGPYKGVSTDARGTATFAMKDDGSAIHYTLHVEKTDNATMAHIHMVNDDGSRGAIAVWLFPTTGMAPGLKEGMFTGTLAEGDITSASLTGSMQGGSVKELYEKLEQGKAGVAVHTKKNPGGELWGDRKAMGHGTKKW